MHCNLIQTRAKISSINTQTLDKIDQDKPRQRFNNVTLFDGMSNGYTVAIVTPKSAHKLRETITNNSHCDIPRKMRAVVTRYELKKQVNTEILKVLSNKRGMEIENNNRHLLICESGYTIERIDNLTWLATKQEFKNHDKNYKNSMKYCRMTVWEFENCDTCIKYHMLKHVPSYDELSIGGCISVGAQGTDDVFDSLGIVYSYYLEFQDAYFVKSKHKTKYYNCKKYLQKIHNATIENMELYIRPYPSKSSFNSENFDSNPMISVTNSEIESKPGDIQYQYGYIEHMALLILSKDNGAIYYHITNYNCK